VSPTSETVRGLVDLRGLVHAHSAYSHDACDGEPVDADGVRSAECFADFRRGVCQAQHDFVFLTDHGDSFDATEYPDTLLFSPDQSKRWRQYCDDCFASIVHDDEDYRMKRTLCQ
jgi:hypothetical protein